MTVNYKSTATGFTTVEVLITLFVGVMLLSGGYQLYAIVKKASADSRNQTDASNIVYEKLRIYSETETGACVAGPAAGSNITSSITEPNTLPGTLVLNLKKTCPFGAGDEISLITVTLSYGETGARNDVSHALYSR